MWIRSQDKTILTNGENEIFVKHLYKQNKNKDYFCIMFKNKLMFDCIELAKYSTLNKAKKVLDEIERCILFKTTTLKKTKQANIIIKMPLDSEVK